MIRTKRPILAFVGCFALLCALIALSSHSLDNSDVELQQQYAQPYGFISEQAPQQQATEVVEGGEPSDETMEAHLNAIEERLHGYTREFEQLEQELANAVHGAHDAEHEAGEAAQYAGHYAGEADESAEHSAHVDNVATAMGMHAIGIEDAEVHEGAQAMAIAKAESEEAQEALERAQAGVSAIDELEQYAREFATHTVHAAVLSARAAKGSLRGEEASVMSAEDAEHAEEIAEEAASKAVQALKETIQARSQAEGHHEEGHAQPATAAKAQPVQAAKGKKLRSSANGDEGAFKFLIDNGKPLIERSIAAIKGANGDCGKLKTVIKEETANMKAVTAAMMTRFGLTEEQKEELEERMRTTLAAQVKDLTAEILQVLSICGQSVLDSSEEEAPAQQPQGHNTAQQPEAHNTAQQPQGQAKEVEEAIHFAKTEVMPKLQAAIAAIKAAGSDCVKLKAAITPAMNYLQQAEGEVKNKFKLSEAEMGHVNEALSSEFAPLTKEFSDAMHYAGTKCGLKLVEDAAAAHAKAVVDDVSSELKELDSLH